MYSFQELSNIPTAEKMSELTKTLAELHLARLSLKTNQLKETHKVKALRKYVAQIKTSLRSEAKTEKDGAVKKEAKAA
jgi:ribosomal protein L29